jgi:hypothetical protein
MISTAKSVKAPYRDLDQDKTRKVGTDELFKGYRIEDMRDNH